LLFELERFTTTTTTRRQNFFIPPRRAPRLPLIELTRPIWH
jgi:hypothetical protein